MSAVDLVLTDTRIWARGPATHWDGAPTVVLGSDGGLVVGAPFSPPDQVSSAVQFVDAERIALPPRIPAVAETLTALFGTVLGHLGLTAPCERITVVCPTEWGARRRGVIAAAARRYTDDVAFEELAVRAVATDDGTLRARRIVVLEFGSLTTTGSVVARTHQGIHVESCEYEPDLAAADLDVDPFAAEGLTALLRRLLDGGRADVVQVFGTADPATVDLVDGIVRDICGAETELRPVSGVDLVRGPTPPPSYRPDPVRAMPDTEWLQPLRQRAAAHTPRRPGTAYLGAAAAAVVLVAAAIGAFLVLDGSDDPSAATAAAPTSPAHSAPATTPTTTTTAPPTPRTTNPREAFGPITFEVPEGWRIATPTRSGNRLDLTPEDGARLRLTLVHTPVDPAAGYTRIAADLEAQMAQKPSLSDLRRDVVFAGRPGLSYIERPDGDSTVHWHVLVEHGTQVSIGCQYAGDGWERVESACERFAESIDVRG